MMKRKWNPVNSPTLFSYTAAFPLLVRSSKSRFAMSSFYLPSSSILAIASSWLLVQRGYFLRIELLTRILLAECYRVANRRRVQAAFNGPNFEQTTSRTMASIIAYREDPHVFRLCLASYRAYCPLLVVAIDGNEEEDLKMVNVFRDVHSQLL